MVVPAAHAAAPIRSVSQPDCAQHGTAPFISRMPKRLSDTQLDLFPRTQHQDTPPRLSSALRARFDRLAPIAAAIPASIRFGTSSWSFPGWEGIVYEPGCTESSLARDGLMSYVRHPLLRTVGIDRGYYAPLKPEDLQRYARQLPPGFPCCAKVPSLYTSPVRLERAREHRGSPNPHFLDASRFIAEVAVPTLEHFRDHAGPLILEFPPLPRESRISPAQFLEKLDLFLRAKPSNLPLAVELRDKSLLTVQYADLLAERRVGHVYNYWSAMPMPLEQAAVVPLDTAEFVVIRLMLRPGTRYSERKSLFAPFDRIVDPNPELRDQVLGLLRSSVALGRAAYVLVNNKAEGSAPLTIEQLASQWSTSDSERR